MRLCWARRAAGNDRRGLGTEGCCITACAAQVAVLLPLFSFCYFMYKWERSELVPIRPAEGEELPANMLGARPLREAKFLETLERRLSGSAALSK
jgi:hypothetical protein